MARLTLNDDDKKVREWLRDELIGLGCKVTVDKIGNMFAALPAQENGLAPIMMGSHLDTQPTGGRYDGILGIMAALEVLRTIKENDIQTRRPIGLVNWTKYVPPCPSCPSWKLTDCIAKKALGFQRPHLALLFGPRI